ncbi:hypothetical protein [Paractinoplanes lichenicola]|uniref:Uncharacterized protein n=1 Tax=Paractinoplanes lichenicola TaxID=2802976 RepID=A0ABS1W6I7_9ACTN|nr:hypothetical protein [Actinoplanes lichenicola]MBL7262173.1 hypothetical protein [Actinoplanes lichenicola]
MDGPSIKRWAAAAVPWWVSRVGLLLGWVVAVLVAVAADNRACSVADPQVCGPDVTFAVGIVILLATPVLLWWLPLAGCAAGVVFAVLDVIYDDLRAANVAFALHGLLCLAVAAWIVSARRRQAAVVAEVAEPVRLDTELTERLRDSVPGWGGRSVIAGLLIVIGAIGLAWYNHRTDQVARHEAAAVRAEAVVRSVDNSEGTVVLEVPRPVEVDVLGSYEPGQVVPVLVDGDWVRPVDEPEDVTVWLSIGLGALALALLLLVREQRMRAARRRLLSGGPLPGVELTAAPDQGRALLHDGLALVPVASTPRRLSRPRLTGEEVKWEDSWKTEETRPQPVTVAGDLRDGGWVLLLTEDAVLLPEAPVRTPRRQPAPGSK